MEYIEILTSNARIQTARLVLRPFMVNDKDDVFEYGSDPETLEHLIWEGVTTLNEAEKSIIGYLMKPGVYALELKDTHKCIGGIDLRLDPEHEKAGFGYALNRKYWNQGYMTEALAGVICLCFGRLNLNRIEACHFTGNEGSGRVMQKCGMNWEGISIEGEKVKGVFRDVVHYGLTRGEWQKKSEG